MFSVRYMRYYSLNVHNMLPREPICLAFGAGVTCRGLVRHPEAKENPEASRATHEWTDFVRRLVAVERQGRTESSSNPQEQQSRREADCN